MKILRKAAYFLVGVLSLLYSIEIHAQEQKDSLVILMSATSAQLVDVEGASYRKIIGPARFLHNGTYLICDTAYWNVDSRYIEAWGNVRILQEETVLDSDKLTYLIDSDLAQFRGTLVQLQDKDHNTLRTRHLDYNTKDSVAIFRNGASMRDKDGQIIESSDGSYESKVKTFTFTGNVNMFTDSIFVKTGSLKYQSDYDLATFYGSTDAWKADNMLSSSGGWYDRSREIFFFKDNVHLMSGDQEGWCDSLYFYRATSDVEMLGNVQVSDTTRNVFALAGRIHYADSSSTVSLSREPAVITQTQEKDGSVDTVYLGAEHLVYQSVRMCDIDSAQVHLANERLANLAVDPVGNYRKQAAEEAAKAAEEAAMNDPNYRAKSAAAAKASASQSSQQSAQQNQPQPAQQNPSQSAQPNQSQPAQPKPQLPAQGAGSPQLGGSDSLSVARPGVSDSLAVGKPEVSDSLAVADPSAIADSLAVAPAQPPKDTTKIGFLRANRNVRIFKKDIQIVCDSLLYCDLDSLARLFKDPQIWQEKVRQYSADSIFVAVRNGSIGKASLMSNAFITIQEDQNLFDQIKGAEMLAYFDVNSALERFDVLGGASAVFFLKEQEVLATVNKAESKMLSAIFKGGEIQKVYYYDEPKNDGYPVVQLAKEEQRLKGFKWTPELRPADRNAVTTLSLRSSQRLKYASRPRARFTQTDIYFPGYISDINRQIRVRDSLRVVRERERQLEERRRADQQSPDSLAAKDSLDTQVDTTNIQLDSLTTPADSSTVVKDSLATVSDTSKVEQVMDAKPLKQQQKERKAAEREAARQARIKAREQRWEEKDRRDADKLKAKEEKRLKKLRKKKRKALEAAARGAEKDAQVLERYRQRYLKKLEKEQLKKKKGNSPN